MSSIGIATLGMYGGTSGTSTDSSSSVGGGTGVVTMYREKPFPSIIITNIKEDEENLNNINIYVNNIVSLNI